MKKLMLLAAGVLVMGAMSGCAGYGAFTTNASNFGAWYTDTTTSTAVGGASIKKSGSSESMSILGLIAMGDAGAGAAAANGGITKVAVVDTKFMHILGIYAKTTTTVHGE